MEIRQLIPGRVQSVAVEALPGSIMAEMVLPACMRVQNDVA